MSKATAAIVGREHRHRPSTPRSCCTRSVPRNATVCPRTPSCSGPGEAGYVGGQEDMIIDIALTLQQERETAAGVKP